MRARFKWNRAKYQHARRLARMFSRFEFLPSDPPEMVRRYFELWEQYPEFGDPLLIPLGHRRQDPDIPF